MGRILQAFAEEGLIVEPSKEWRTPEHQKACEYASELVDGFEEHLNAGEKEQFEKVLDAIAEEQRHCLMGSFARGYSLGVLMMLEVMEYKESFLIEK